MSHPCAILSAMTLEIDSLTEVVETRRQLASQSLDPTRRADMGQFFTPEPVAMFLASMFDLRDRPATLLDPGAGVGSLTAAFVARWADECDSQLHATACEVDDSLHGDLRTTLGECELHASLTTDLLGESFIEWGTDRLAGIRLTEPPGFDFVIQNPPYRKLAADSHDRRLLRASGVDAPNLYAAFLALGARLLAPGGQMVAITPRSFANGPYFKRFRQDLLQWVSLRHIHVYDSRDTAFADAAVLQENVIVRVERTSHRGPVRITSSVSPAATAMTARDVPYAEVVRPDDPEQFIHLSPHAQHADIASALAALPDTVASLNLKVSTGRVVDFRVREHLRQAPDADTAPLVYPTHLRESSVEWPKETKKPNALVRCSETESLMLPAGCYVLVKRFSAKEERRRVVASLVRDGDLPGEVWAFENHLNVFHLGNRGLPLSLAAGLVVWLNSTSVDLAFRQFSGHTQVNATDLRNMRYPSAGELVALGDAAGLAHLTQDKVDALVSEHVAGVRSRATNA